MKTISSEIMRTLCDVCESAAALVFCAADEASLCRSCDEKVYLSPFCNFVFTCFFFYLISKVRIHFRCIITSQFLWVMLTFFF